MAYMLCQDGSDENDDNTPLPTGHRRFSNIKKCIQDDKTVKFKVIGRSWGFAFSDQTWNICHPTHIRVNKASKHTIEIQYGTLKQFRAAYKWCTLEKRGRYWHGSIPIGLRGGLYQVTLDNHYFPQVAVYNRIELSNQTKSNIIAVTTHRDAYSGPGQHCLFITKQAIPHCVDVTQSLDGNTIYSFIKWYDDAGAALSKAYTRESLIRADIDKHGIVIRESKLIEYTPNMHQ
jgi:hypothetical protein